MAVITVNTGMDDTVAGDDLMSLREAIEIAGSTSGADTIRFADGVSTVELLQANGVIYIAEGEKVLIDVNRNNDGIADVEIMAKGFTNQFFIEAGATAKFEGLILSGGRGLGGSGRTRLFRSRSSVGNAWYRRNRGQPERDGWN